MMMLVCLREKSSVFEMQLRAVANGLSPFLVKFGSLTIAVVFVVMMMTGSKIRSTMLVFTMACTLVGAGRRRANETFDNVINKTFHF